MCSSIEDLFNQNLDTLKSQRHHKINPYEFIIQVFWRDIIIGQHTYIEEIQSQSQYGKYGKYLNMVNACSNVLLGTSFYDVFMNFLILERFDGMDIQ